MFFLSFSFYSYSQCDNDNIPPDIDLDILDDLIGECELTELTAPTATDECDGQIVGTTDATLPITESTTITWTYTDSSGNTTTQTQEIIIDTQAPLVNSTDLLPLTAQCEITSLDIPTATDNCDGIINGCIQFTVFGITFCTSEISEPITESTTITWSYVDSAGNNTTQTQIITIINEDPTPEIESLLDLTAQCEITELTAPTATDNCDGQIVGTTDATLPITESTTITWNYTDSSGNTTTQTQEVQIIQAQPPTGETNQLFCNSAFIYELVVSGSEIQFYDNPTEGNLLNYEDSMTDGQTVYASQIINGCESEERLEINITIKEINAPSGENSQTFCLENNTTIEDIITNIDSVIWYDSEIDGNILPNDLILNDGDIIYGANLDSSTGCESQSRIRVIINIIDSSLDFYNLITINGNDLNNKLKISNIENFPNNRMYVYNRAGKLVWSISEYDNSNNAFYGKANVSGIFMKDNFLPTGTYYFILNYVNPCINNELKGFIQINNNQ